MVEWKKLISVSDVQYGYPFESSMFTEDSNYIPLIRIRDVKPAKASTYYSGDIIENYIIKKGDILVGMDGEFNIGKWDDRDGLLNQRVLKLKGRAGLCLDGYLFHYMGPVFKKIEKETPGGSVKHLSAKAINNINIPVPAFSEQIRIVDILDTFTSSIENLKEQIAQRRKQYEYYRDQLLDLEGKKDVEMKTLGSFAEIGTGSSNTQDELENGKYPFFVRSQIVRWKNEFEFDETAIITSGDGVGVGKVLHYYEGKYALHQRAYRIKVFVGDIVTKYLFYFMQKDFYSYIMSNAYAASVTSVRKPMLINYPIPIPSYQEQKRIVDILDTFEASISNLETQLAEREKQYEYYRNKLLTFE